MLEKDMFSWTPIRPKFNGQVAFRSLFLDWKVNFEALVCTSKPKVKLKFSSLFVKKGMVYGCPPIRARVVLFTFFLRGVNFEFP